MKVVTRSDIDLIRYLSRIARDTRKPGQTLGCRLTELRSECEA